MKKPDKSLLILCPFFPNNHVVPSSLLFCELSLPVDLQLLLPNDVYPCLLHHLPELVGVDELFVLVCPFGYDVEDVLGSQDVGEPSGDVLGYGGQEDESSRPGRFHHFSHELDGVLYMLYDVHRSDNVE